MGFGSSTVESWCFSACKNVLITLLAVLFMSFCGEAQFHRNSPNDYPEVVPFHSEHEVMSGREIKLKCDTFSCNGHKFRWEFKSCGKDYMTQCQDKNITKYLEWSKIKKNITTTNCSSNFSMITKSSNETGLYRCLLIGENEKSSRIVHIHQVNVIDRTKMAEGSVPKLIDFQPTNMTVFQEMKIVIQCKVYSVFPVEIRWFKEAQNGFMFNNISYKMLNGTNHIFFDKDIYLSKLTIERASENDSGMYTCAALNSIGAVYKDAYVKVVSPIMYKDWQSSTSFSLLFFIPLGLALIPIIVWLCYYRKKKSNRRKIDNVVSVERDNFKYYPVF